MLISLYAYIIRCCEVHTLIEQIMHQKIFCI